MASDSPYLRGGSSDLTDLGLSAGLVEICEVIFIVTYIGTFRLAGGSSLSLSLSSFITALSRFLTAGVGILIISWVSKLMQVLKEG